MTSLEFVQQLSMGNERGRARDREREREMLGCSLWDGWLFQARAPAVAGAVPCQVRAASVAVEGGVAMPGSAMCAQAAAQATAAAAGSPELARAGGTPNSHGEAPTVRKTPLAAAAQLWYERAEETSDGAILSYGGPSQDAAAGASDDLTGAAELVTLRAGTHSPKSVHRHCTVSVYEANFREVYAVSPGCEMPRSEMLQCAPGDIANAGEGAWGSGARIVPDKQLASECSRGPEASEYTRALGSSAVPHLDSLAVVPEASARPENCNSRPDDRMGNLTADASGNLTADASIAILPPVPQDVRGGDAAQTPAHDLEMLPHDHLEMLAHETHERLAHARLSPPPDAAAGCHVLADTEARATVCVALAPEADGMGGDGERNGGGGEGEREEGRERGGGGEGGEGGGGEGKGGGGGGEGGGGGGEGEGGGVEEGGGSGEVEKTWGGDGECSGETAIVLAWIEEVLMSAHSHMCLLVAYEDTCQEI